jgi:hypothetical protein
MPSQAPLRIAKFGAAAIAPARLPSNQAAAMKETAGWWKPGRPV